MKFVITYLILIISLLHGQVCCSLVGIVSNGSGNVVSAHFPNEFVINKNMMWNAGVINSVNFNNDELIKYPFGSNGYFEISDYLFNNTIGFINASYSVTSIWEHVSFEKTSTYIIGTKGQLGIRSKLNYGMGLIESSLIVPVVPYYTNQEFAFKTGVVPSYTFKWILQELFDSNSNFQIGLNKNFKEKRDVFVDNNINLTLWREEQVFNLYVSPYLSLQHQKLISPLAPFDDNRDSRLMRFVHLGINLIPLNPKYDFIQLNLNIPIYSWVSEIGFPDGTIPSTSLSVTIFSKDSFKKEKRSSLFD